eukprot:61287-Prymnesium_polylepis.5
MALSVRLALSACTRPPFATPKRSASHGSSSRCHHGRSPPPYASKRRTAGACIALRLGSASREHDQPFGGCTILLNARHLVEIIKDRPI